MRNLLPSERVTPVSGFGYLFTTQSPARLAQHQSSESTRRAVRDILPIAHFECIQKANWDVGYPVFDAYDFCERVYPIRKAARDIPLERLMRAECVQDLCVSFANCLDGCVRPNFRNPRGWQDFVGDWTVDFNVDEMHFSESGPYVLAILFHNHLTILGLLTSWTIVDVLGRHMGLPPIQITQDGLGRLLEDLSIGGPPIFDVEAMRSEFPDRYSL